MCVYVYVYVCVCECVQLQRKFSRICFLPNQSTSHYAFESVCALLLLVRDMLHPLLYYVDRSCRTKWSTPFLPFEKQLPVTSPAE